MTPTESLDAASLPPSLSEPDLGVGPLAALLVATPGGSVAAAVLALGLAAVSAALRTSLMRAVPGEVLKRVPEPARRARFVRLLGRSDVLASSANLLEITFQVIFAVLVVALVAGADRPTGADVTGAIAIAVPLVLLVGEWLPTSLARSRKEAILAKLLPTFAVLQTPAELVVRLLELLRRAILRGFGISESNPEARQLVEGFRAMVESEELEGPLEAETRELLANVMEFRDVDAAEVMTPRTEIVSVPVTATLREAIAVFAESGYSRIPVYSNTIDTVIGTLAALEAAKAIAEDRLDRTSIADVMRPPLLVPETKRITELLAEFRAKKQKMAIVVDEYGGTAGLVTLSNVVAELVGEVPDDEDDTLTPIKRREDGSYELEATLHVSEVNEELGLDLPEEADFETLGGFVLAEFGRFPRAGEAFMRDAHEFSVLEASDRRVLRVLVRTPG
jgi:putative hemolysin